MGDSSSPPPPTAAASPGADAAAGGAAPVSAATTGAAGAGAAAENGAAVALAASGSNRRPVDTAAHAESLQAASERTEREDQRDQQQQQRRRQTSPSPSSTTLQPPSATTTPPRRRSFFSRFSLPFRTPARTVADFHIRPAEPHRKYVAGDHVLGAVVLAVVKPLRITHLTVSLRGLVSVFKDPSAAAAASLPADTVTDSSSGSSRLLAAKSYGSLSSSSSSFLGNGHALLFRDEMVLSGTGRLEPGNYEFEFDLIFPSQGLPSSIDFERGSICYVVTATLTRPTTVAPIQSCERKVYLVDPVDISAVSKPRSRTISLEPISKRSKKRKIVVVTQPPPPATTTPAATGILGAVSTISFASGGDSDLYDAAFSERGSARDSAHETIQTEENEQDPNTEGQSRPSQSTHPRSPAPTDIRSEISVESVASRGSGNRSGSGGIGAAPGSGSGSGAGAGGSIIRLASPVGSQAAASTVAHSAATATGTYTSSSTITNHTGSSNNAAGNNHRSQPLAPVTSVSTNTVSGVIDDRTITATIELLKGGCLPGEVVSVKISVQHVKRIKSLHGVVVTLYRQGRIDSAPPDFMFPSAGTSIAEDDEVTNRGDTDNINESQANHGQDTNSIHNDGNNGILSNGTASGHHDEQVQQSRKQKKQKEKEDKERVKQLKERSKEKGQRRKNSRDKQHSSDSGSTKHENYYPKSKTGLGGLSLTSAGSSSVFRKDLSQSFSPLIIDPRTLQSSVTASVRVPEDAFATIKGVPGDMISFKYQLEVIVDLGGKLANLLQSGVGPAGPTVVNSSNPYDGKPLLTAGSALWGGGRHMIDTDQLRRQKGVIYVAFEVVVGTTDTSRQRGRGLKAVTIPEDAEQQSDQQQQQQEQPPQPYFSPHPPDWYPEDRKGQHQPPHQPQHPPYPSWPANGVASGSVGPSAPGGPSADDPYYQYQRPGYNQGPYDYYEEAGSLAPAAPHPPYTDRLPPPSAQAPQYVPTAAMLAAERDPNVSEKERIRRAEERLLPSQPGELSASANGEGGSGSGSGSGSGNGGRVLGVGNYGPTAPTAPSLDESAIFPSGPSAPGPSQPPLPSMPSMSPTEDKQELERRRLLAEASAPPDFPDDYEDAGPSGSSASDGRATRVPIIGVSGNTGGINVGVAGPSAPVLEEEDGHHHQYQRPVYRSHQDAYDSYAPHVPADEGIIDSQEEASAPSAYILASDDNTTAASTAPAAEGTDEDPYGRHYTYGPGTASETGHGGNAGEPTEPLPRYER